MAGVTVHDRAERPYLPKHGVRAATVGNGNDVSATGTGNISQAVGSFDSVTGVTSETGKQGANAFSLQLNTNPFTTSACSGATDPSKCRGWQQFIYANTGDDAVGILSNFAAGFMQYWLLGYGSNCPSGWNSSGNDCWTNSGDAVPIVRQDITNLANLSVAASPLRVAIRLPWGWVARSMPPLVTTPSLIWRKAGTPPSST
jgi:hypothetical protein